MPAKRGGPDNWCNFAGLPSFRGEVPVQVAWVARPDQTASCVEIGIKPGKLDQELFQIGAEELSSPDYFADDRRLTA